MIVTSKLNKLLTLVRKAQDHSTIDQLCFEINSLLAKKAEEVRTQLESSTQESPAMPELSEELNKLVLECNVKSKINKVTN